MTVADDVRRRRGAGQRSALVGGERWRRRAFDWPRRRRDGNMQFVAQLRLGDDDSLAPVMCANDPGLCDEWDASAAATAHCCCRPAASPVDDRRRTARRRWARCRARRARRTGGRLRRRHGGAWRWKPRAHACSAQLGGVPRGPPGRPDAAPDSGLPAPIDHSRPHSRTGQEDRRRALAGAEVEHPHPGPQVEVGGEVLEQPQRVGSHVQGQQPGRVVRRRARVAVRPDESSSRLTRPPSPLRLRGVVTSPAEPEAACGPVSSGSGRPCTAPRRRRRGTPPASWSAWSAVRRARRGAAGPPSRPGAWAARRPRWRTRPAW